MNSRTQAFHQNYSLLTSFVLVLIFSSFGFCDDGVFSIATPVTLTENAGQPAVLKIDENHEATVYLSHSDPLPLDIKFEVAENLCVENYQTPKCHYSMAVSSDHLVFVWSKHLDQTKIGQPMKFQVKYSASQASNLTALEDNVFATSLDPLINQKPDARFKPETLTCDQYAWLGDQFKDAARLPNLRFKIWTSESMKINAETGINENRTTLMAENLLFKPLGQDYALNSMGRLIVSSTGFNTNILLAGQMSTLQIMGPNPKQLCQISISPNVIEALKGRDIDMNYKIAPNYQVYLDFKNEHYTKLKSRLSSLLQLYPGTTLEFQ